MFSLQSKIKVFESLFRIFSVNFFTMKKIFSLLVTFSTCTFFAQTFEWANAAGSSGDEVAMDISTEKNSGTNYIIGNFRNTMTLGAFTLTSNGGTDIFFAKVDSAGNYLWAKSLGSIGDDDGNGITFDISGNVYIVGGCRNVMAFSGTDSQTPMGAQDGFLAKYDQDGNYLWYTPINNNLNAGDESAIALDLSENTGRIFVAINEQGQNRSLVRRYSMTDGSSGGVYSMNATTVNIKDLKVRYNEQISPSSDEVYIVGAFEGSFRFGSSSTTIHNATTPDMFVVKISNWYGSPFRDWSFVGGGTGDDICNGIDLNKSSSGGFSFTGEASTNSTIGGTALGNTYGYDAFVGYYTENLTNGSYTKEYIIKSGVSGSYGNGIVMDDDNNVYLAGYGSQGAYKNGTVTGLSSSGIAIVKILPNGYIASRLVAPGSSYLSSAYRIGLDNKGNAYSFGNLKLSNDFSVSNLSSVGGSDLHLEKINYLFILSPAVATVKCVSDLDGPSVLVHFASSKKLNSDNIFTLQLDITGTGDFVSYTDAATLAADSSGTFTVPLPGGSYSYADFRIVSSSPAFIGDQSYLDIYHMLTAAVTVPPGGFTRCSNSPGSATAFTASGSDGFATYTFSPSSGITGSSPNYFATPSTTTTYTMSTSNSNGCVDTVKFTVVVNQAPTMTPANDPMYTCPGSPIQLTNTVTGNVVSYLWSPAATLSSTTDAMPIATPTSNTNYTYTITTAENCSTTNSISVFLYAPPTVNAGPASLTTCLGSSVPLSGTGSATSWQWTPTTGVTNPTSVTTSVLPNTTTTYRLTGTESTHGCTAKDSITIVIGNIAVSANNATITCGNSATLTATPSGNYVGPLSYSWTPASDLSSTTGTTVTADPINTTSYYVTMTTGNGCSGTDDAVVTVNSPNYNVNFNATVQLLTAPPFVAQFSNTTPNPSDYTFTWIWGDGTSTQNNSATVFHNYQFNGNYDVTLIAVNNVTGCSDTLIQNGYIFCTGGTGCTLVATVDTPEGTNACIGDSVLLTCNTSNTYFYQWNFNGAIISGATLDHYYAQNDGNYSVTITEGACSVISDPTNLNFTSPPTPATITPSGNINLCGGGTVFLTASSGYPSYSWNTGETTQNITVSESGVYTVSVGNGEGCFATTSYSLNASSLSAPDICMVGVDSLTGKNLIIWDKPISMEIDSFVVYREGIVANVFDRIHAQEYASFSTYLDPNSNPQQQAYRYKISVIDTCGVETLLSEFHKTIHLTINAGAGSSWNLIWNLYEGLNIPTYNIYSGTDPNSLSLLTSISGLNNSYTDLTPPAGIVYYQIEAVHPSGGCNPTVKSQNYLTSFSNVADNASVGVLSLMQNDPFSIFPNPSEDVLTLLFSEDVTWNHKFVEIIDGLGRVVYTQELNIKGGSEQLLIQDLKAGIYLLKVKDLHSESALRFVKTN